MKVTEETYSDAVWIYLKNAYDDRQIVEDHMTWIDGRHKLPNEVCFGCKYNPHMKMRISKDGKLWVDTNDSPDPPEIRQKCKEIQKRIHKEWEDYGFDVLEMIE